MKVVTESDLRRELSQIEVDRYCLPEDTKLTPAALSYLRDRKIAVIEEKDLKKSSQENCSKEKKEDSSKAQKTVQEGKKPKYIDFETGAFYYEKPEHMTQLFGNYLIAKDSPRILFRGKLDSLQALVVLDQTLLQDEYPGLAEDLDDILQDLYRIMGSDIMNQPLADSTIIGLNHAELREHSHNPMKFYKIKQMVLPDKSLGREYALLNQLRAAIREVEVSAAIAFRSDRKYEREDIIEELNRLSSAAHIIMCRFLAGEYRKK